jgi:dTDP-4-dehydrorhamnose 3,5-epimerase
LKFVESPLNGAFIVEIQPHTDERGFFARTWCRSEFEAHGLDPALEQISISFNAIAGTLRGLHFQAQPRPEVKLVRCTRGRIFDVIVDLRQSSKTFGQWFAVELSSENHLAFYVPGGFAHGFQTLEDNTEVLYQISTTFEPHLARGVLWNDPAIGIVWPYAENRIVSQRDLSLPKLESCESC